MIENPPFPSSLASSQWHHVIVTGVVLVWVFLCALSNSRECSFPSRLVSPLWDCVIITIKVFLVYDKHMIDNAAFPSNLVSCYGVMAPSPLECFCSLLPNGAECSAPLQPVLTAMASYHCHCHHSVSYVHFQAVGNAVFLSSLVSPPLCHVIIITILCFWCAFPHDRQYSVSLQSCVSL